MYLFQIGYEVLRPLCPPLCQWTPAPALQTFWLRDLCHQLDLPSCLHHEFVQKPSPTKAAVIVTIIQWMSMFHNNIELHTKNTPKQSRIRGVNTGVSDWYLFGGAVDTTTSMFLALVTDSCVTGTSSRTTHWLSLPQRVE